MTSLSEELLQAFSLHDPEHSDTIQNALYSNESEQYQQLIPVLDQLRADYPDIGAPEDKDSSGADKLPSFGSVEHTNSLVRDLTREQHDVLKFLQLRFEKWIQLSEYIKTSLDYATVALKLLSMETLETINEENFDEILPNAVLMLLKMNISSVKDKEKPFSQQENKVLERAAKDILEMEQFKKEMLRFLESKMIQLAPNISALVGTRIAAQLIGAAGGLGEFARLTADDIQSLGREKGALLGLSSKTQVKSFSGFIGKVEMMNTVHPRLRKRVEKMIANKLKLVANIDLLGNMTNGSEGERYLQEIQKAVENMEKPPPNRQEKPLPAPVLKSKKRRGGSKSRHLKELHTMTAIQKLKSRIKFGVAPVVDEYTGEEYGMLGIDGDGSVPMKLAAKTKVKSSQKGFATPAGTATGGRSTTVQQQPFYGGALTRPGSGLASSLAFNSTQSMQLPNPKLLEQKKEKSATKSYFSHHRGFSCAEKLSVSGAPTNKRKREGATASDFAVPSMPRKRTKNKTASA